MHHYRQIILNMNLQDDVPLGQIETLAEKIQENAEKEIAEMDIEVSEMSTRVN